jgi:hypothetical protein
VASLSVEGGLLVARDAGHGYRAAELGGLAVHVGARARLRQRARVHAEQVAQLGVPAALADVEQHRARCVREVGGVLARELEDEPRVDRAEGGVARHIALADQPFDLRAGEVGVEHEPGALADERRVAGVAELVAAARGAAVLPDDRAVERLAGVAVPGHDGLALVRDADPGERAAVDAGGVERLLRDRARDVPDLGRVVLDPAGSREVLLELAIRATDRTPALVEHDARRAGGALVDREDHARRR